MIKIQTADSIAVGTGTTIIPESVRVVFPTKDKRRTTVCAAVTQNSYGSILYAKSTRVKKGKLKMFVKVYKSEFFNYNYRWVECILNTDNIVCIKGGPDKYDIELPGDGNANLTVDRGSYDKIMEAVGGVYNGEGLI